uniref:metal-sulfur cluster assembly factor n=1 Tax=Pedobacter schmidteae TaxID=2201271 RepID=UPI0013CF30F0|nr:metal-sulfur cluster assembly factor [Pedobacter schmidteae]
MIVFDVPDAFADAREKLIDTLKTVIDPELYVNIVDLGLVYALKLDENQHLVVVEMTLSSRFCPMSESILSAVKNAIERTFAHFSAEVKVVWEPEWSYKSISPEGIKKLRGR